MSPLSGSSPGEHRAGGRALSLFASPLNPLILRALAEESCRLSDLRQRVSGPAETTLRAHLGELIEIGAVAKLKRSGMPYSVSHELTPAGHELLFVADVLEAWLAQAPQGEIELGTEPAKAAIKALGDGWGSAILRALASGPLSLTELDDAISSISYPALERRLATMRATGQIESVRSESAGTPYAITDWARLGIGPLSAAGRWERRHLTEQTEPVTWVEVEAAFLMTLPLVELPVEVDGECVLAVDTKGEEKRIAGVHILLEDGRVISCDTDLGSEPPTFALGTAEAWLEAVIDGEGDHLHISGNRTLVAVLVREIHAVLFASFFEILRKGP